MSDMLATMGLDRRGYTEGLRAADREARLFGRNFEKAIEGINMGSRLLRLGLGANMIGRVFGAAAGAVNEYAKTNADAALTMQRMSAGLDGIKAAIGAGLVPVFEGLVAVLDRYTDGLASAAAAEQASIRKSEALREERAKARKATEDALAADGRYLLMLERLDQDRAAAALAALTGPSRADAVAMAGIAADRQIEDMMLDPSLTAEQKTRRMAMLSRERERATEHAGFMFDLRHEEQRKSDLERLGLEEGQRRIALMRARGDDVGAMRAQAEMAISMGRAGLGEMAGLTGEERAKAERRLVADTLGTLMAQLDGERVGLMAELGGRGTGRARGLAAGVGGALGASAVFGAGGYAAPSVDDKMLRAQERLEKIQTEQKRVLERIEENTGRGTVALAG